MNRRILYLLLLLSIMMASFQRPVWAEDPGTQIEKEYHWNNKLGRGAMNLLGFPGDFVYKFHVAASSGGDQSARTIHLVKGMGLVFARLGAGVVELLTFPFNFPDPEKKPILDPEFFWQDSY